MNAAAHAAQLERESHIEFVSKVYLNPGELHLARKPTRVTTVLGSCVALTIFSPSFRMGGICHGMLPNCPVLPTEQEKRILTAGCRDSCFRYIDCSILYMLRAFDKVKVPRGDLQVKLFGGSDMFSGSSGQQTVGSKNLEVARELIRKEGLRLTASNLGGGTGRKLHFFTHTGEVLMKHLNNSIREIDVGR